MRIVKLPLPPSNLNQAQYEYMIRTFDPGGFGQDKRDAKLSNDVNRLAKVGWEIDSFHALGDTQNARSRVVFKRLLKDD